jgi:pseudouridine synthase
VGRLDYASEGLVLLTNDGDLAQKLMHASSHVPKTYLVKVAGKPNDEALAKLRAGVMLAFEGRHLADVADWIAMISALLAAVGLICSAYLELQTHPKTS